MRTRTRGLIGATILVLGSAIACAPHSFMQITPRQDVRVQGGVTPSSPHDRKIFLTKESLPAGSYQVVAKLDVTKTWYGSNEAVLDELADMARELGADVVIDVADWQQPVGFSWSAPQGFGTASF